MEWIQFTLSLIAELALTLCAIDFVSGFVHWAEDTFGTEMTPVLGKWIITPNVIHHDDPVAFTEKNWLQSSWDLTLASGLIVLGAWLTGHLTWHIWLFAFIGANANQLHKYGHLPQSATPYPVRILQKARILQDAKHHGQHHIGEKNLAYCVVTPYLNPVLDRIGFWRGVEKVLVPVFGAPRREDLIKN